MKQVDFYLKSHVLPYYFSNGKFTGKNLEIRVFDNYTKQVNVGDVIVFNALFCGTVAAIHRYDTFEAMLMKHDKALIAPSLSEDEILFALQEMFRRKFIKKVIVFELINLMLVSG